MNKDITYGQTVDYDIFRREQSRIRDWTFRVMIESQCHEKNCVLTLTYNDEHLPSLGALSLHDYQCFLKSYRKAISPIKIRFFGCGEYGSKGFRPHYHIIIFGACPDDLVFSHKDKHGISFYRSNSIANIWGKGFCIVCPVVCKEVIPYVCKYLQKFNDRMLYRYDGNADGIAVKLPSPFITMSRRPGIGASALDTSLLDLSTDKLYFGGKSIRIPRYYLNKIAERQSSSFYFIDSDGDLVHSSDLPPAEYDYMRQMQLTYVDEIRRKRRNFWQGRFDCDKYVSNVVKFTKFRNERNKTSR